MNETMSENVKKPRRRFRNVLAVILTVVFGAVFAAGTTCLLAIGNTGASLEEAMEDASFYELRFMQATAEAEVSNALSQKLYESAFWVDGKYDELQTVDITNVKAGIHCQDKNPATTYKLEDLVAMYNKGIHAELYELIENSENFDTAYPEIIQRLSTELGTTEYFVDNQGYLYAARGDDGYGMELLMSRLPQIGDISDLSQDYGVYLYFLDGDTPTICNQLPEGSVALDVVSWEEFSARYMLGMPGLSEEEQSAINYGDYGVVFQYLYKHGKELETLLPASGMSLADYALNNPAEVSLMDSYKQLAEAVDSVGYAVNTKQGLDEEVDSSTVASRQPLAYYWLYDGKEVWTNNPAWETTDIALVEDEIEGRFLVSEQDVYPMYVGKYFETEGTGDVHVETMFLSFNHDNYITLEHTLVGGYGIESGWYVIGLNPSLYNDEVFLDIDEVLWECRNVYNMHMGMTLNYLLMCVLGGVGVIVFGVLSFVWAGKRDKTQVRYAGVFAKKAPIELLLLLFVGCWIGYAVFVAATVADGILYRHYCFGAHLSDYIFMSILIIGLISLGFWQILTLVCKGKSRNMKTNSLIGRAGNSVVKGIAEDVPASAFVRNCPIEVLLAIFLVCWIIYFGVTFSIGSGFGYYGFIPALICICIVIVGFILLAMWHITMLVRKVRSKSMKTNSLIGICGGAIIRGIKSAYLNRKVTGKLVLCSILFGFVSLLLVGLGYATYAFGFFVFLLIVFWIVIVVLLMKKCMQKQRLKEGIHEIAGGNLEYQIEMNRMTGDELDMARDLNNLKDGMENAVERMMKSERMKTDLITNVSHDLKTPLTSIINYVDILKKEDIQDEKIRGYIEILEQKSLRLKNLTEDLMEAAKISSGNITLEIQNINLKQLLYQTNGEFEEKFARRNLSLVCTLPESDVYIKADGRRMWRVIENLYNNAAKYAQPYSRVYVDGKLMGGKVILIIKNVSEAPLNISADELMERFVRGDVARNTEGSGLGLEIARNLTIMQQGTFEIQLDGDLFKVVLTFDAV